VRVSRPVRPVRHAPRWHAQDRGRLAPGDTRRHAVPPEAVSRVRPVSRAPDSRRSDWRRRINRRLEARAGRGSTGHDGQRERTEEQHCLDQATTRRQHAAVEPAREGLAASDEDGLTAARDHAVRRIGGRSRRRRPRTSGGRVRFAYRARTNRSSGRAASAFDVRAKLRFHRATTPRRLRGRDLRVTAELNPLAERRRGDRS